MAGVRIKFRWTGGSKVVKLGPEATLGELRRLATDASGMKDGPLVLRSGFPPIPMPGDDAALVSSVLRAASVVTVDREEPSTQVTPAPPPTLSKYRAQKRRRSNPLAGGSEHDEYGAADAAADESSGDEKAPSQASRVGARPVRRAAERAKAAMPDAVRRAEEVDAALQATRRRTKPAGLALNRRAAAGAPGAKGRSASWQGGGRSVGSGEPAAGTATAAPSVSQAVSRKRPRAPSGRSAIHGEADGASRFVTAMQAGGGRDRVGAFFRLASKTALERHREDTLGAERFRAALAGEWKAQRREGPGEDGLPAVTVRFKPDRGRKWLEDVVTDVGRAELLAALRVIAEPLLRAQERGRREGVPWREASGEGEASLAEGLRPERMAVVSPRIFWAVVRHTAGGAASGMEEALPEVDWSFLSSRQRRPSRAAAAGGAGRGPDVSSTTDGTGTAHEEEEAEEEAEAGGAPPKRARSSLQSRLDDVAALADDVGSLCAAFGLPDHGDMPVMGTPGLAHALGDRLSAAAEAAGLGSLEGLADAHAEEDEDDEDEEEEDEEEGGTAGEETAAEGAEGSGGAKQAEAADEAAVGAAAPPDDAWSALLSGLAGIVAEASPAELAGGVRSALLGALFEAGGGGEGVGEAGGRPSAEDAAVAVVMLAGAMGKRARLALAMARVVAAGEGAGARAGEVLRTAGLSTPADVVAVGGAALVGVSGCDAGGAASMLAAAMAELAADGASWMAEEVSPLLA